MEVEIEFFRPFSRHTFIADKTTNQESKTTAVKIKIYTATKPRPKLLNF
jgi:hypothetical protein